MKRFLFPLVALVFIACSCSNSTAKNEKEDTETDGEKKQVADEDEADVQSDPVTVMKAIFKAARSGNYTVLSKFCDPDGDGDVKRICDLENQSAAKQEEFQSYFKKGKVTGDATIDGNNASVDFTFGPDGTKSEEMNMVKKGKKWYLSSF